MLRTSVPPPLPDLRKQVMAKLLALKQSDSASGLVEAQALIAKEYGFDSWTALQSARPRPARAWRNPNAPLRHTDSLAPERFRMDGLLDQESDIKATAGFLRTGLIVQAGFLLAALAGLWLLFFNRDPGGPWTAAQHLFGALF